MSTTTTANKANNLIKINFDKIKKDSTISERLNSNAKKATIYIYPDGFNALQINSSEGKSFRVKRRKELNDFNYLIRIAADKKDSAALILHVTNFLKWYKTYFINNDFTLNSFTNTKGEIKEEHEKMLSIIKIVKEQITPAKDKKVVTKEKKVVTKEKKVITPEVKVDAVKTV